MKQQREIVARYAQQDEIAGWDELVSANPDGGSLCQMREYAEIKEYDGWHARYVMIDTIAILVLEKHVISLGTMWYVPKGPGVTDTAALQLLLPALEQLAIAADVFVVKIEPDFCGDASDLRLPRVSTIQANASTVVVDITHDSAFLLKTCSPTCRSAYNHAQKAGVIASRVSTSDANCQKMYELLCQSSEGRTKPRPYDYYRRFWKLFDEAGKGALLFAYYDGQVVAGCFITINGKKAAYKDGGSIRQKTLRGASNFLQFAAIDWARKQGATSYDMYGATPTADAQNHAHPYYGITKFKQGFGGVHIDSIGCFDVVIKPVAYRAWCRWAERVARKTTKIVKKSYWY